jgi:hypothetical protein
MAEFQGSGLSRFIGRDFARAGRSLLVAAAIGGLLTLGGALAPARAQVNTVSIWIQTMDSCKQSLGSAAYVIKNASGSFQASVTTPASSPHSVSSGNCPLPRGSCTASTDGCVQVAALPVGDSFQIRETATPPATNGNPFGYAPCNGGSACRSETANVSISSSGAVSALTTNAYPDGTFSYYPGSTASFAGTAADPIVFHDFGLGSGSCDGDGDADDHLTGSPSSHCPYLPESAEASACQPYPWSCTLPTSSLHFSLSNPGSVTAGTPFNEKITALDSSNKVVTSYTGGQTIAWYGPSSSPSGAAPKYPANPVTFSSGVAQVSITLPDAQSTTLTAQQGNVSGTVNLVVAGGPAARLGLTAPPAVTAGQPFNETLSATDAYGNVAAYSGGHSLSWSGPANAPNGTPPAYPANPVTFSAGTATVSLTLFDVQTTTLGVSDGALTGSTAAFSVAPAGANFFAVATPANQTAGTPFSVSISALDKYGNTATGYAGSQSLTFSGPLSSPNHTAPVYPASVSFVKGVGSGTLTLFDAQTTTLTATQATLTGTSGSFTVNAGRVAALTLGSVVAQTAGVPFNAALGAADAYGNPYTGGMCVTFSGPGTSPSGTAPSYPPAGSCATGQSSLSFSNGAASPAITLYKAQQTALTATSGSFSASSGTLSVLAGSARLLRLGNPGSVTAGTPFTVKLTALDAWGNTAKGYPSPACLAFSGPVASPNGTAPAYPGSGSCSAGRSSVSFQSGVAKVSLTLFNAASTTLSASDGSVSGTSPGFTVGPRAASSFNVANPGPQLAGTSFSDQIRALDAYGNTATSYGGSPSISGPHTSPSGSTPQYSSPSFAGGVATVTIRLFDAETTSLTATDGSVQGSSGLFSVAPTGASTFNLANPGGQQAGVQFNETITAVDPYGNQATTYPSTACVAFGGPDQSPDGTAPSYPGQGSCDSGQSQVSFSGGVASVPVTLFDAESTSLSAAAGSISGRSGSFAVSPGTTTESLSVELPASSTPGTPVTGTASALDPWGNMNTSDTSTLSVTTSDPLAVPDVDYQSTANLSGGTATFSVTFPGDITGLTYGTQSVTVLGLTGDTGMSASGSTQVG